MKLAVIGAGAMGSLVGARLALAGEKVLLASTMGSRRGRVRLLEAA